MFNLLMRLLGLWGFVDALFMLINPSGWSSFWQRRLSALSKKGFLTRALGAFEFVACLWLLKKTRS